MVCLSYNESEYIMISENEVYLIPMWIIINIDCGMLFLYYNQLSRYKYDYINNNVIRTWKILRIVSLCTAFTIGWFYRQLLENTELFESTNVCALMYVLYGCLVMNIKASNLYKLTKDVKSKYDILTACCLTTGLLTVIIGVIFVH